ncbi:FtsW/RodA/SpoVE family cell cycle protein [Rossellomorea marisflavi]|uniref:FtsW/RodA/SpoVE family cell cycle protein n=1 Tax=Rossellomorea marisflavi TaxID=189381 RepID=UPI00203B0B3D|nr:FtsW/RodA/SpoVE family cell cycle protein [Rossellomorea marisflavi]MCM2603279.1 FtsW/RodA/SpoVE family cell cycle protein [Rossellomorea marisflavi]
MGMNEPFKDYISAVCSRIRNKDVHEEVALELEDHLHTLKERAMKDGMSEKDAVQHAISQMGDPVTVGKQLHQTHRPTFDVTILIPVAVISVFGLVSMYFIQFQSNITEIGDIFQSSLIYYLAGLILMIACFFYDYRKLSRYSGVIYGGTVALLLLTQWIGVRVDGIAYLDIGFAILHISGIAPFLLVIAFAGMFSEWNWQTPKKAVIGVGLLAIPIMLLASDGFAAYALGLAVALILMVATRAKIHQILLYGISVIALPALFKPDLFSRVSPEGGAGIRALFQRAGWFGADPSVLNLNEMHTDYILAYMVHSFGWVSAIVTLMFTIVFTIRLIQTSKTTLHSFGRVLTIGFAAVFGIQFATAILTNIGLLPPSGITMPFMSFGGTHVLADMMAAGLVLSVYRRRRLAPILASGTLKSS